jgi:serpin B
MGDKKMNICSKNDIKALAGIMAASVLLGGCSITAPVSGTQAPGNSLINDPSIKAEINFKDVKDAGYDSGLMDQEYRRYCFNIFSQTVKDYGGDSNVMISPASLMMALDMVAAGAKGDSLKQLTDLFATGQAPLTQQAYAADLMDKINSAKDVDFTCANAVWNNGALLGDEVNLDYVNYVQETFLAEYVVTDFDEKTPEEINKWVDEHTDHMIEKIIDELEPLTVMVLVNAISFEGKWEESYDEDHITEGSFNAANGEAQTATFLNDSTSAYYETGLATGFIKRYEGGQYAFLAILPAVESVSANEFAANFTAADYEEFINSVSYDYDVYSKMPEFKSDFDFKMNETLKNLGVTDVFDETKADLSGIAGVPGILYVSRVLHKTHIEVDREGTKAAAATAVTIRTKGVIETAKETRQVICDRPFVYAIVDTDTMAPVFIGTVNEV